MRDYNGKKTHVMIERRKCQNPDYKKLHRCLPSQLTRFKHFLTEIIENAVDGIIIPEDPDDPTAKLEGTTIRSLGKSSRKNFTHRREWRNASDA